MKTPSILAAALALSACVATAEPRAIEGPVRMGQIAYVNGPRVRPEKLIEDSRCPMNARCVWAGRAIVRAAVTTGSGTRRIDLTLGKPERVADGMLTLVSITPERVAGAQPKPAPYRFAFEFAGGL
ncbi:hypothetical protein M9980_04900 [Sphingomonas donggukensis]|uniref:TonB C-terminal domain-containing protein n=1 Tax=Sphingomonas donggukensis TaxID=2949093 RepID=A0ABY4TXG0_9SPHN|nr:hypothetical protein [Sphingomonas donggukensis]URW76555.1 hypothetical protein M9980_04900 [Sphingomonas donggukensis]